MARIRQIKPAFFTSEDITAIRSYRARLTFIGLWTHVDDNGRCRDNPRLIRAAVWPLEDDVTLADVEDDLTELARLGRIRRYDSPVGPCIQVSNFNTHQKINNKSKTTLHGPDGEDPQPSHPPPDPATQPHIHREPRHAPVSTRPPVTHNGVPEPSGRTHVALDEPYGSHVATCENNVIQGQFAEGSRSPHVGLPESSRSTGPRYGYGYGYGYGGGTREDALTIDADASPPRCRRHQNLPADDPGPKCVGCRSVRLARERAAGTAEQRRAVDDRQARIDAQLAARRTNTAGASPSARQAARDAYRASQARKRATS